MAEILPTPRAGTWLRIDSATFADPTPRAGTWLRIDSATFADPTPRAGTWLRIDSVPFTKRPRAHLGLVVHTGP